MASNTKLKTENKEKEVKTMKKTVKAEKKVVVKAEDVKAEGQISVTPKRIVKKEKAMDAVNLSVNVLGIDGKAAGKMDLPEELFGQKINKTLIAQAVRVFLVNQRQGNASTKTRGEVDGSSKKIYRQKGTGRARHGTLRAPIFVKGGIVFGPKPRDYNLSLPQKMKQKALVSALSAKVKDSQISVISGLASLEPKTKLFAEMLEKIGLTDKKINVLFVMSPELQKARRAGQNIQGVQFANAAQLNVYEVMRAKTVVLDKTVIALLQQRVKKEDK